MGFDGKVVLLAGAGGLGAAVGEALIEAGATLAVADVDRAAAEAIAESARDRGVRAVSIGMDITRKGDCEAAVEAALSLGPLHGMVNCVGLNRRGPSVDVSEADWDLVLAVNLKGCFLLAQATARAMIRQRLGGRIVFVSSQFALVGMEHRAAYCASKGGVSSLARALAVEWAPNGITVNALAPSFVRTALNTATLDDPEFGARLAGRIPMGRLGRPDEVAGAALYLLSDAASFVTGVTLPVDGGWVAS